MTIRGMNRSSVQLFFAGRNEFPSYVDPLVPLSPVASKFYDYGPPPATRYLPFWIAGFVDRAWVLLLTLAAISHPSRSSTCTSASSGSWSRSGRTTRSSW